MARQEVTIVTLDRFGKSPHGLVKVDETNKGFFSNNHGETLIEIYNAHPTNPGRSGFEFFEETVDGVIVQDKLTDLIPAGGTVLVGPFPTQYYSRDDFTVNINPVAGSAHSVWIRGYELNVLG